MVLTNLGGTLTGLGDRGCVLSNLEEAIKAYREALSEFTRAQTPLEWGMLKTNIGGPFLLLGERKGGIVESQEATQTFQQALSVYTPSGSPTAWASTQRRKVGNALVTRRTALVTRRTQEREFEPCRVHSRISTNGLRRRWL